MPLIVLIVGFLVSIWQAEQQHASSRALLQTTLERETEILRQDIHDAFAQASFGLRGARGAIGALGGSITQEQFQAYVRSRHLPTEFPGIRGFGFADKIPPGQLELYQERVRSIEGKDFTVRHLSEPDPNNLYVIRYIEPPENNRQVRGLNVGSEPRRLQAAQLAAELGLMTITSQVRLVQDDSKTPGVLMYVPVYEGAEIPPSIEDRRKKLRGLLYAPIVISELLYAKASASISNLCITLREVGDSEPWFAHPVKREQSGCSDQTHAIILSIGTHEISLQTALPQDRAQGMIVVRPLAVLGVGVALTLALASIVYLLLSAQRRAEKRAQQMTLAYRQANLELQASLQATEDVRRRLSHILEATHVGTWEWNVQTGETVFNERWATILGYTLTELHPVSIETWTKFVHPDDRKRVSELLQKHFAGESEFYESEARMRHRNGSWVWVYVRGQVSSRSDDGKPLLMFGTHQEITDRKQAASALELFKTMIDRAKDPFFLVDIEDRCRMIYVNEAAKTHFGASREQIYTWHIPDWDAEFTDHALPRLVESLEKTHSLTLRSRHRTASGQIVPVEVSVNYVVNEQGRRMAYGWFRDISERLETERLQRDAKERAESANHAKSSFLAMMSHEIRTPLNALIGTAYLLGHTELSDKQRSDLRTIEAAGKSLLALINDILDFSKIEAGELLLDPHDFLLSEILEDLRAMFSRQAAEKGLTFSVSPLSAAIPTALVGDGNRLRQCLINLLGNAIKFTDHGSVTLTVDLCKQAEPVPANRLHLRFCVRDTGLGMSPEQMARLYNPFSQADVSTTRRYGGSGLGLSIVKRLVLLMNGNVGVESTPGVGTHFWLELPFDVSRALPPPLTEYVANRPLHVLVAEDDPTDRAVLARMAADFGWASEGITSGQEMIGRVLERATQQYPVDCILLDSRMMGPDGQRSVSGLRKQLADTPMPSVILITSGDQAEPSPGHSAPRPDGVLSKPFVQASLFHAVNTAAFAHGHDRDHLLGMTRIGSDHGRWLPGVRVLVVDDSRINLDVIGRILEREGAEPTLRESGWEALQALNDKAQNLDAVLMDLQMPEIDGCETTQRIRKNPAWATLPIIALTAGATASEQQRSKDSGMDDFLVKPIDPIKMVRVLRRHIQRYRDEVLPVVPMKESTSEKKTEPGPPSVPRSPAGWPEIAGFDMEKAAAILGEPDFFQELLVPFLRDATPVVAEVRKLIDKGDASGAARRVHKLRGQAGNLGAASLSAAAGLLEQALKLHSPELEQRFAEFAAAHTVAIPAAQKWQRMQRK